MKNQEKANQTVALGPGLSAGLGATFEGFLESRGFHAYACQAAVDPDFYQMAKCLWKTLVKIGDKEALPTAFLKGQAARNAST